MAKEEMGEEDKRKTKSFFHLVFPILILALIDGAYIGSIWYALALKVLVFFWVYITLRNFVENVYL